MESPLDLLSISSTPGPWPALALDVTLRATLALAAAALAGAALRHASASVRHLVWTSALAGTLAMPFLVLALPSWRVPILPRATPAPRLSVRDAAPAGLPATETAGRPARVAADGPAEDIRTVDTRRPHVAWRATTPVPAIRTSERRAAGNRDWTSWIALAWGFGAVVVLLPLVAGHAKLRWIGRRAARSADLPLIAVAERLSIPFLRSRRIVWLQSDSSASPMTWGVLRPVILLPAGAEGWPEGRLRAVLLHELGHVSRWDCLTQMLARLACAAYWFHPLVWMAAHRLRVESEQACDDLVLRSGSRPVDYASHLLEVARTLRPAPGLSAAAIPMARPSQLEGRLRAILDRSRSRGGVTRRGACLLLAAVAALLLPLSAARLGTRVVSAAAPEKSGEDGDARSTRRATMTVSGRVLDPDGRPVAGAKVAVVGRRKLAMLTARADDQHVALGLTESDAGGRFRLEVSRTSSVTHYEAHALATAPGFGLGWAELNRDAESPSADVTLGHEQVVEGRLVDLQGSPAVGVDVRISSVGIVKKNVGSYDGLSFWKATPEGLGVVWPEPVVTDDDGRFRLAGIGRRVRVGLRVDDPRFARQDLSLATDEVEGPKRAILVLQPVMHVSGRVTCADTGEPLRDALVVVDSGTSRYNHSGGTECRTGADGRYEANPAPGTYLQVTAYPPLGSPYLIFARNFQDDRGEARRVADLAVPRGVLINGRITERGSGRPLSGASVYYQDGATNVVEGKGTIPGWMAAVPSGPDGRYTIAVTPGKGHLLVYGPTADFVHEMKGSGEFYGGNRRGNRYYAHAFLPYEVEEGQGPIEIDVALKPGLTLAGRVVSPDGQAVDTAEIITTLSISPFHTSWRGDFTIPVREGRFELHGLAPDRPVKCSFLDAKKRWGTTIEVTGAMAAGGPLTVRLQPCGTATARLVDEQGRPVAKGGLNLNIVATQGPGTDYEGETLTEEERAMLSADEEIYANVDRRNYWEGPRSDSEGRITLPALIPGATYRIYEYTRGKDDRAYRWRDFTVEAGRTTDLGDVRVKTEGR